jgi:hypothetical protein
LSLVRLFIDPLERLLIYIKMKEYTKYAEAVKRINVSKRYFLRVGTFVLISISFLIVLVLENTAAVQTAFTSQASTKSEVQLMSYAYQVKMNQMVRTAHAA